MVTHDVSKPAHTRRGMAFVNALYDGKSELSGIFAKRARDLRALEAMIECGRAIPALSESLEDVLAEIGEGERELAARIATER